MIPRTRIVSAAVVSVLVLAVGTPTVHAASIIKCLEGNAKASLQFVKKTQRATQICLDRDLKGGIPCSDLQKKLDKQETKLRNKIQLKCGAFSASALATLGFPGKCLDANPADLFTVADLQDCMFDNHSALVANLIAVEYGSTPGGPTLDKKLFKCQRELAKQGWKFNQKVVKNVQKCRSGLINGKLTGFAALNCQTSDPKTAAKIAKADSKARKRILSRCDDALNQLPQLDVCPGTCAASLCKGGAHNGEACTTDGDCSAQTAQEAADCILEAHLNVGDNPVITAPADMIDFEYATARSCGDGVINRLDEECDLDDDAACPGKCGDAAGSFGCLCTTPPAGADWVARERPVEHVNADLDNGWTGRSHDSGIVEGGGYVTDLYDCDGPGGADVECTGGPSCKLTPHAPCVSDANCSGAGNFCRKDRTATGPHCHLDVKTPCTSDAQCTGGVDPFGVPDFCLRQFHGAPLPISAGGISVCILNVFSEDVVGTSNVDTGASAVRLRQDSITHLGPTLDQPCPVCGGFCSGIGTGTGPGTRSLCTNDSDCTGGLFCVLEPLCSYGPNIDQLCRPDFPAGGPTDIFGNPSQDCLPNPGTNISGGGLDILFNPATTGAVNHTPVVTCDVTPFNQNVCVGGTNDQKKCPGGAGDCPGGTCGPQCYCPTGGGVVEKPNDCASACVGGANDALACGVDSQCPGGFCHDGDCRLDPGDPDSAQEGRCTVGPADGGCSVTFIRGCDEDDDCQPASCPFCEAISVCIGGANDGLACQGTCAVTAGPCDDNSDCPGGSADKCTAVSADCPGGTCGEQCIFTNRQCFVNGGPIRIGEDGLQNPLPGVADRTTVSAFCIAGTGSSAINGTAGLPGPGMLTQPVTVDRVGF